MKKRCAYKQFCDRRRLSRAVAEQNQANHEKTIKTHTDNTIEKEIRRGHNRTINGNFFEQ